MRRAIQELVDQGLLVRRRGPGHHGSPTRRCIGRVALSSLYDDLERDGRKPRTEVLEHEMVTDEHAAAALDLDPETPLLHVVRVRKAASTAAGSHAQLAAAGASAT